MGEFVGVVALLILGCVIGAYSASPANSGFTCTQQRAVKDTMPQEFECVQWTKENEDGKLR